MISRKIKVFLKQNLETSSDCAANNLLYTKDNCLQQRMVAYVSVLLDESLGASASGEGVDADAGLVGVVVVACGSVDTVRVLEVF